MVDWGWGSIMSPILRPSRTYLSPFDVDVFLFVVNHAGCALQNPTLCGAGCLVQKSVCGVRCLVIGMDLVTVWDGASSMHSSVSRFH